MSKGVFEVARSKPTLDRSRDGCPVRHMIIRLKYRAFLPLLIKHLCQICRVLRPDGRVLLDDLAHGGQFLIAQRHISRRKVLLEVL